MEIGAVASITVEVNKSNVAGNLGSGDVDVFATPSMVATMEHAAAKCVEKFLQEGQTTVGTYIAVSHIAATPIGMQVICYAELVSSEGKTLEFRVWGEDEYGPIGEGTHTRAIIHRERFLERVQAKKIKSQV